MENRYSRQIILNEIGDDGQLKIKNAKVLVVGVGGLGSASSVYLAGAGVGTIGLVDFDRVSVSNLQRQVLYTEKEVGLAKTECAARRLKEMNSEIEIATYDTPLTKDNAEEIIRNYDIVVDGCDNMSTRLAVNEVCFKYGIPYIYGAISEFGGQVSVLCCNGGKSLMDLFEVLPAYDRNENNGVMGTTPGIVGAVQANQAIQLICKFGEPLIDRLWIADFLSMNTFTVSI